MVVCFVENLTLRTWCSVFGRLLHRRLSKENKVESCYFFDGSPLGILAAQASGWFAGLAVENLAFRLIDVRDETGLLMSNRVACRDLGEVLADVMREPAFRKCLEGETRDDNLVAYLAKSIAMISYFDRRTLWRALTLVQVCVWKTRNVGVSGGDAVLFLERRLWTGAIGKYASRFGVTIVPVPPSSRFNLRALLRRLVGANGIELLRALRDRPYRWRLSCLGGRQSAARDQAAATDTVTKSNRAPEASSPRVAVEYYGHLNLNCAERHSDLFFWQQSSLAGSDVLLTFALSQDPLDEQKWSELTDHGIKALALNPRATTLSSVPVFDRPSRSPGRRKSQSRTYSLPMSAEQIWLGQQTSDYVALREYWTDLFASQNVKVYVSWYRYDMAHCAIAAGIADCGGVCALYQRAYQPEASPATSVTSDIMFGYSPADAAVERRANSKIRYHVSVGYLGDHRFAMLRGDAKRVRDQLRRQGARRVIAYFDENSHDEERWLHGHTVTRENYAFLLEKVLADPSLGLVCKPKAPSTLHARLGPVAELLDRAKATGRCYVYDGGVLHGSWPPAAAALAADVAIHGHLVAATAGLEAALAGVPTLLMDRERWQLSPLYRLGVGNVVFTDWDSLWEACVRHWSRPGGVPGFGDWSPMFDEFDPFRDGRAAERMGTYIKWLIDGFKTELDRETVMADAAERYCKLWGKDKVIAVNTSCESGGPENEKVSFRSEIANAQTA